VELAGPVAPPFGFFPDDPPDEEPDEGVVDVVVVGVVGVVVLVVVVPVVTVADGVGLVEVDGAQLAEMSVSPGGTSDEGGVPGAALTVSVAVLPVGRPTVSVHVSAEALGIAAIAIVTSSALAVMATVFSFRLVDTLVYSSRHGQCVPWTAPRTQGGTAGTLTIAAELCNEEPSLESVVSGVS
jgi:hypothetical protein